MRWRWGGRAAVALAPISEIYGRSANQLRSLFVSVLWITQMQEEAERSAGAYDDAHLAAVEAMLSAEGMAEAAELLREAESEVVETGYDNWNGGTRLYTVFLSIDPASYGRLGSANTHAQLHHGASLYPRTRAHRRSHFHHVSRALPPS